MRRVQAPRAYKSVIYVYIQFLFFDLWAALKALSKIKLASSGQKDFYKSSRSCEPRYHQNVPNEKMEPQY